MSENDFDSRLSKAETLLDGLLKTVDSLASNVQTIATTIREHAETTDKQINSLAVEIIKAGAPKQANWLGLISASVAISTLLMAIGAAVLLPLNQRVEMIRNELMNLNAQCREHELLQLHPVGKSRIDALEIELRAEAARIVEAHRLAVEGINVRLDDVYEHGSPVTRERLALIEDRLKRAEGGTK